MRRITLITRKAAQFGEAQVRRPAKPVKWCSKTFDGRVHEIVLESFGALRQE